MEAEEIKKYLEIGVYAIVIGFGSTIMYQVLCYGISAVIGLYHKAVR